MQSVVSITSQGQLTIPQSIRKSLGIKKATKATIEIKGNSIVVKPKKDFWSLEGALKSDIVLSDIDLQKARGKFSKTWGEK